jgi:primase-polymerase (primpol)-like protein
LNNDPATWATLAEALRAVDADGLEGIGLQLLGLKGIGAIDLDDVRDPLSGEILPWAVQLVEASGTYAEVTPSQPGLRLIGTVSEELPAIHTARAHPEGGRYEIYANLQTGRSPSEVIR